jgi:hypothetical protein
MVGTCIGSLLIAARWLCYPAALCTLSCLAELTDTPALGKAISNHLNLRSDRVQDRVPRAMPGSWTISVAGQVYGPYSLKQMCAFAAEGRLARQSLVAPAGEPEFRRASDDPELASIFQPKNEGAVAQPLQRDQREFGRAAGSRNGDCSHMLIVADLKSGSIAKLEEEIATFGQSLAILPQAWLLASQASVNTVRNKLVQQLGKLDVLFVADASSNKAAWFNFGPEVDARIRKIWRFDAKLRVAS